jgi:alkane 1-monooxygenase
MTHYLKHSLILVVMPTFAILATVAPLWGLAGALALVVYQIAVDVATPRELAVPEYGQPWLINAVPYVHIPTSAFALLMLAWMAAPGDLFGIGQMLDRLGLGGLLGTSLATRTEPTGWGSLVAAAVTLGFVMSTNTIAAHELVHRTASPFAVWLGRWILATVGDAQYSITHVYVHHLHVGTPHDPSTAKRGENLYAFALRSVRGQYRDAWQIEMRRLRDRPWLLRAITNKVTTGLAMSGLIALAFWAVAGWRGAAAFAMVAATSKFLLEAVEYIQHYGLVRTPGGKIESHHSWECSNRAASHIMYNLPRHAHHHLDARLPYSALKPTEAAPDLPYGYVAHILLSMAPPLWRRFAAPRLAKWDAELASPAERELAQQANRESRLPSYALTPAERS